MRENKTVGGGRGRRSRRRLQPVVFALAMALSMLLSVGCGAVNNASDTAMPQAAAESGSTSSATSDAGGGYDYGYDGYAEELYEEYEEDMPEANTSSPKTDNSDVLSERKLIRTVSMDVEAREQDYDAFLATLEEEVQSLGGYIENMDSYNGSRYGGYKSTRNANLTLRIPKNRLDGFLGMVSEIANVVRRSDNVEDVTLSYVDLESRRNALRTEQDRLLELLERAESIEDIITIEGRLSDVRYQLESMESKLRTMDNQVDFSTVYLYVSEVQELTPIVERTVWERISNGFVDSLEEIGDGVVEIFVWVLVNLPYLVLWVALVAVVIVFVRRHWKKTVVDRAKKKEDAGKAGSEKQKQERAQEDSSKG